MAVYQTMQKLLAAESCRDVRRLNSQELEQLYIEQDADAGMSFQEFARHQSRKVNQGIFKERFYFIRFIKDPEEIDLWYGDRCYHPLGRASITGWILDDQDAIFTPCRYLLSNAESADGSALPNLKEIVSFRGRFGEQAKAGEKICADGTLECVRDRRGKTWHRLLLGNSPHDRMVMQQR